MSIKKFLENFREKRKNEIPPETKTEELCPICKKRFLKLHKPCCGSPHGYKQCFCGYKVNI